MNTATFIISTGRCGTQWIADTLGEFFSDMMVVEHEPLHLLYEPRVALSRKYGDALPSGVEAHFEKIERVLETHDHLECGHPLWSSAPLLAKRFEGRVRFVHLVRHPVPLSFSWLTHAAFQDPLFPHIPLKILLSPFDEGTRLSQYQDTWEGLSPFEKCLYYWTELNLFALEFCAGTVPPCLLLRYEDVFERDGLFELLRFLNLPDREMMGPSRGEVKDRYRSCLLDLEDWQVVRRHEPTLELASRLGYSMEGLRNDAFRRRYLFGA